MCESVNNRPVQTEWTNKMEWETEWTNKKTGGGRPLQIGCHCLNQRLGGTPLFYSPWETTLDPIGPMISLGRAFHPAGTRAEKALDLIEAKRIFLGGWERGKRQERKEGKEWKQLRKGKSVWKEGEIRERGQPRPNTRPEINKVLPDKSKHFRNLFPIKIHFALFQHSIHSILGEWEKVSTSLSPTMLNPSEIIKGTLTNSIRTLWMLLRVESAVLAVVHILGSLKEFEFQSLWLSLSYKAKGMVIFLHSCGYPHQWDNSPGQAAIRG